jgi:hypothetical protein
MNADYEDDGIKGCMQGGIQGHHAFLSSWFAYIATWQTTKGEALLVFHPCWRLVSLNTSTRLSIQIWQQCNLKFVSHAEQCLHLSVYSYRLQCRLTAISGFVGEFITRYYQSSTHRPLPPGSSSVWDPLLEGHKRGCQKKKPGQQREGHGKPTEHTRRKDTPRNHQLCHLGDQA